MYLFYDKLEIELILKCVENDWIVHFYNERALQITHHCLGLEHGLAGVRGGAARQQQRVLAAEAGQPRPHPRRGHRALHPRPPVSPPPY